MAIDIRELNFRRLSTQQHAAVGRHGIYSGFAEQGFANPVIAGAYFVVVRGVADPRTVIAELSFPQYLGSMTQLANALLKPGTNTGCWPSQLNISMTRPISSSAAALETWNVC